MKQILLILLALVVIVMIGGALLPGHIHLERDIVVEAPACTVFALTNGFGSFNEWSPWAQIDPEGTTYEYGGPHQGVGAHQSWSSDHNNVGSGRQEIVASEPWSEVRTKLTFEGQGDADAFFRFAPQDSGVQVTWGFDSDLGVNPVSRIFGYFFLGGMLGPQYEQGLAQLKTYAESLPDADWCEMEAELMEVEAEPMAFVEAKTSSDHDEIAAAYARSYGRIMGFLNEKGLQAAGPPISVNTVWGETFEFKPAIPIVAPPDGELDKSVLDENVAVQIGQSYGGKVVRAVHVGAYADLEKTYRKVEAKLKAEGLTRNGPAWDQWISDPSQVPESELITHVFYPVL